MLHTHAIGHKDRELLRKRKVLESKIESLKTEFESTEEELNKVYIEEEIKKEVELQTRKKMTDIRGGNTPSARQEPKKGKKTK